MMNSDTVDELVGSTLEAHLPTSRTDNHGGVEEHQEVTTVPSKEVFSRARLIAIVIADQEHDAIKKLVEIKKGLSDNDQLSIIVISRTGTEAQVMNGLGTYWYRGHTCNVSHVRRYCGLSFAMETPEIVLIDPSTCRPISTEGKAALLRKQLTLEKFPDWQTNCFQVIIGDTEYTPAVYVHSEGALAANFVPGDIILVRRCHRNLSMACYINPPAEEFKIVRRGKEVDVSEIPEGSVLLSHAVANQLEVAEGETVALEGPLNPPEADSITISSVTPTHGTREELRSSACSLFGVSSGLEASSTRQLQSLLLGAALNSEETALNVEENARDHELSEVLAHVSAASSNEEPTPFSWLGGHISEQRCRYIPVAQGDAVVVSPDVRESNDDSTPQDTSVKLRIQSTQPLGTVLVGPNTTIHVSR
eukprot:gb/GECG01006488.1/.p1 GENE.gb/GECG01006488.1/~~gb/GECG01006488.1/.p1  ORF type:complete len:420 (+),score=52.61 gb/GECG01006488.1/:1-1260(+)